jgi:hypothetical protein
VEAEMMNHDNLTVLKKARCLAKKALELSERKNFDGVECHYALDDMAQEARYILWETQELEAKDG